jgi:ribonuclease P protein component
MCYAGDMQPASDSARLSFPKTKRLTTPEEFGRVKSEGTAERGRFLVLGVFAREGEPRFRVGFVTSKRLGGAVTRNQVRRRLRDVVRTEQGRLRPGFWLVVVARPAAARASYAQLKDEWLRLAERASILAP